jgi:hypothetical protein
VIDEVANLGWLFLAGRGKRGELSDDLLFALLSHQVLSTSAPVLAFMTQLLERLPEDKRQAIPALVASLLGVARRRQGTSRYAAYRPVGNDTVRTTAAYTANLVILDVLLRGRGADPCPADRRDVADRLAWWASTRHLCIAGVGPSSARSWESFLSRSEVPTGYVSRPDPD